MERVVRMYKRASMIRSPGLRIQTIRGVLFFFGRGTEEKFHNHQLINYWSRARCLRTILLYLYDTYIQQYQKLNLSYDKRFSCKN